MWDNWPLYTHSSEEKKEDIDLESNSQSNRGRRQLYMKFNEKQSNKSSLEVSINASIISNSDNTSSLLSGDHDEELRTQELRHEKA